jgi:hypothetical protein
MFLVSSLKAFKKFNSLDLDIRTKLGRIEYYMILIRNFPKEKLNALSGLTDKEIEYLDAVRDMDLLKKLDLTPSGRQNKRGIKKTRSKK